MKIKITLISLGMLIGFMGCGKAYRATETTQASSSSSSGTIVDTGNSGNTGSTGTTGGLPPINFSFIKKGDGSASPSTTVYSDSILRIKLEGGTGTVQNTSSGYNNYYTHYGCIKYTVTVNGHAMDTGILRSSTNFYCDWNYGVGCVNYDSSICCPSAPTSEVLDFSSWIASNGSGGNYTVKISQVAYNRLGCSPSGIYTTHAISGTAYIQTNGTTSVD